MSNLWECHEGTFQVRMYAYEHNSQPFSELKVSPHKIVLHTQPRVPPTFDLNLNRNTSKVCISKYCSQLPEHSHYDKTDINSSFREFFQNPFHNFCFVPGQGHLFKGNKLF